MEYRTIELKLLLQEFDHVNCDGKCYQKTSFYYKYTLVTQFKYILYNSLELLLLY